MNTDKFINDTFPQDKAQQFSVVLKDAIKSYIENMDNTTVDEWLYDYLSRNLTEKSADAISTIANNIITTVKAHNETLDSMHKALESGQTAESWFQKEISADKNSGQNAYELVSVHTALTEASNCYTENDEQQEVLDVDVIPPEEWEDSKWNKYRTKDLVIETVRQAGETALRTTASDICFKATEYGFQNVLNDNELIKDSLITGASTGLKVAVSGAMEIADSRGLLPEADTDTESRSLIAVTAIENVKILGKIAKGEINLTQGLKEISDTSVATIATIVKTKVANAGKKVGKKIGTAIGAVFGPVGATIGSFVGGAVGKMTGTAVGTKIVETAKRVGEAAKTVISRVTDTVKSVGNKIKNGLRKLFNW